MRHLVPVVVAHSFGQGTARADPAAVRPFAPEVDDQRDDDEGLHEANRQPPPQRLAGEDVPKEQRPSENQPQRSPVFATVLGPLRLGKQAIGHWFEPSTLVEPAIVASPRQEQIGQQKERNALDRHQRQRLHLDVRCASSLYALQAEEDDAQAIGQRVVETRLGHRHLHRVPQGMDCRRCR